ncbi:hypothetical protein OBBRIDRAFT_551670 [Obba rivulosa]|uniref:Uncharacterized protein n=1 Tax=Obba rivulosa TaxID=1052685 RepID=A0A8E2AVF3_9APHY|nr:hypothetical protein OBBRIDRAFT_551670 [Obba rivulosa]
MSSPSPVASATSSAAPSPSSSSNVGAVAAGVTIALLVFFALLGALFWLVRRRRQQRLGVHTARRTTLADLRHPAYIVTPFGSPSADSPRYLHNPGANMRVARRRSDGGWEFDEIKPRTLASFDLPPPSPSPSSSPGYSHKDKLLPGELTTRGYVEHDVYGVPPPAYAPSESTLSPR